MSFGDEFSFVNDLAMPSIDFSVAERLGLSSHGLTPDDIDALGRAYSICRERNERRILREAMIHYRLYGEQILARLNQCLDEVFAKDYPQTVGAGSLFGKARCDLRGFEISNNFRPLYARLLTAKRPKDTGRIVYKPSWADCLILAKWAPITTGKDA